MYDNSLDRMGTTYIYDTDDGAGACCESDWISCLCVCGVCVHELECVLYVSA
jgi:hypothetical protein